ncbi:MAG: coproporphyrinogen dehydrogenase HemZ [Clostridiales bacterium]|nr:coproporphyrinogen dehydrogenase HemZ [Clostridiales bacterium]
MKIITELKWMEADFIEASAFFEGAENLEVEHTHEESDGCFFDTVKIGEKEYSFQQKIAYKDEIEKKRYVKRYAKLALYKALSDYLGQTQVWGALTGIRPVKYAYSIGENWRKSMAEEMLVDESKLDIIARIIEEQKEIYELKEGNCDFFVSIPFCPTRCLYCSFLSNEIGKEKQLEGYIDSLVYEIEKAKPLIKNLRSVYIGGGTPVSLPLEMLERVLKAIGKVDCEYTVEAGRPDCIERQTLELLKKYGVTRICVNPQSFNDKTLQLIGRKHTADDIREKYALAKEYGFDVNMDLIAGLNGESFEDFKYSIDEAIKLSPDNITVHTLSLKKGSKLKETTSRLAEGEIAKMIDYSVYRLINSGFNPYYMYRQKYMAGNLENTGYTKRGKACVYNVDVMEEITDNLACGANAVTKKLIIDENRIERYGAPKDIKTYIDKIEKIVEEKNKFFLNNGI